MHSTLSPFAAVLIQEMRVKLLPEVNLTFERLFASDI